MNNAGIEIKKPFLEVPDNEWDLVLNVNLRGPFLVTQIAGRQFLAQEAIAGRESRGKIVNISSTHEDIPFPDYTSYCVAKGGLRMLVPRPISLFRPYEDQYQQYCTGSDCDSDQSACPG